MYPVETFTSPYSIFFAGYMQLRSMFSAPLRSAQSQGPPDLVGPVETFTSPYSIFLRGTCSCAPCSPLRFGPPKAKVHWTLWAPSKPLLAHIQFFAGYMQLRSMFSAPLRSAQSQGPPDLVGPVETFTSPYSFFANQDF